MFNRRRIERLESQVEYLTAIVDRLDGYLGAIRPTVYVGYPTYSNVKDDVEVVTLYDLVDEFRRTHTKVECSSHWELKSKG